jgi:Ca2+-binding RTX toxin-like protein
MNSSNVGRLAIVGLLLLGMASVFSALAAANTVPLSGKLDATVVLTAQEMQPQDCNALSLTTYLVSPGGTFNNNGASALIIGTAGVDMIKGGGGNDCIVGGAGADTLKGGTGADICFGDSSTTFNSCALPTYTTLRP